MLKISNDFKRRYKLVKDREIKEKIKDALGVQFQLEFLKRKLKERKTWLVGGRRA